MHNYAHALALIEYVSTSDVLDFDRDVSRILDIPTGKETIKLLTHESGALVEIFPEDDGDFIVSIQHQSVSPSEMARIGAFLLKRSMVAIGLITKDGDINDDVADAILDEARKCDREDLH